MPDSIVPSVLTMTVMRTGTFSRYQDFNFVLYGIIHGVDGVAGQEPSALTIPANTCEVPVCETLALAKPDDTISLAFIVGAGGLRFYRKAVMCSLERTLA